MEANRKLIEPWTIQKAIVLAALCLMAGIAGGWFIHGPQSPSTAAPANAAVASNQAGMTVSGQTQPPDSARLKEMADAKAAPLVEKLKSDPNNFDLLVAIGNIYYDAQQYSIAIDHYRRALTVKPSDAAVRTDMATACWYMGNSDTAIAEFDKALTYVPNNPNTLFNRGLVKWKGKKDGAGALADWEKLLAVAPKYPEKAQVELWIAEVKKQSALKP